jgi:hypothetical protein
MRKNPSLTLLTTSSSPNISTVNSTMLFLGPPGDGKIIIISNSDEEEEACEETPADAKPAPSATTVKPSTPVASPADVDEDPGATPNDSNDGLALCQDAGKSSSSSREEPDTP